MEQTNGEMIDPKYETITIEVDNDTLNGTRYELARILRLAPYFKSFRQIADIIGVSHASVGNYLNQQGITGERYDWIRKSWIKGKSDEELAHILGIGIGNVPYLRKKYDVSKFEWVDLIQRKNNLIETLFGEGYTFGPGFNDYLRQMSNQFLNTERKKEIILMYYLNGYPSTNSERTFRSNILATLKEGELGSPEVLTKMNILRRC